MVDGLFTSPEQVIEAERQARSALAMQQGATPLGASGQELGRSLGGAFQRAFGGEVRESPDVQIARTRMEATKMIDPTKVDSYKDAARALYEVGDMQGASIIISQMPKLSEQEVKGDYYQLTQRGPDGKPVQLGTKFVPKGKEIPAAESGQAWLKIGTGMGSGDTNISVGAEMDSFSKELGKKEAEKFSDKRKSAQSAVTSLGTIQKSKELIEKGIITGFGANALTQMGKGLKQLGLIEGDSVANTEAFLANQGKAVLSILSSGAVGAGTGISDKDVEFIKQVAGAKADLTEESIKRIFDISEKAHYNAINSFNREAKQVDKRVKLPYSTQIQVPKFFDPALVKMKATNDKGEIIYNVDGVWVDKYGYPYE